jgi:hypothetical protein
LTDVFNLECCFLVFSPIAHFSPQLLSVFRFPSRGLWHVLIKHLFPVFTHLCIQNIATPRGKRIHPARL